MAKKILEDEQWTLFPEETTEDEVSGIVFDGSWLWEEYIATVLKPRGFRHCVRGGTSNDEEGVKMFENGSARFYPDFYKDADDGVVLDAKYKRVSPNGARNDVHQVLCYLLLTGAKLGGLVFPPVDPKCEDSGDSGSKDTYGDNVYGWLPPRPIQSPYSKINWRCFSWAPIGKNNDNWTVFMKYMEGQENAICKEVCNEQPCFCEGEDPGG